MKIHGHLVDIHERDIYPAIISVLNGKIEKIIRAESAPDIYILPGLIDSHIHIESSMVTPGAFAMTAVRHGTTAVVSDPHEIANVLGVDGVLYMISDSKKVPLRFWFGAPSCVPATRYENAGAELTHKEVQKLLERPEIHYLSEMMNFPGVIYNDEEVYLKLKEAQRLGKPIDGHAPGLTGEMLEKYVKAGISTDHECSTIEEAKEKISLGMKILIREGSAARNMNALKDLFNTDPDMVMLCSDDLHPEMLQLGHINKLIAGLISGGYDKFSVIRSATINPSEHYRLNAGLLREGESADFILVDNLEEMNISETWIEGVRVFSEGTVHFSYNPGKPINNFNCTQLTEMQIRIKNEHGKYRVIEAYDGELLTGEILMEPVAADRIESDTSVDILKIVVKDRYNDSPPAVGFIRGFNLKKGAFASSVAHDSHNIIAVGANDADIVAAVNQVVADSGGLAVVADGITLSLRLDIAGIMTTRTCNEVAEEYQNLSEMVKTLGCTMNSPFMTLSFMALLVIPALKICDRGLFDVKIFKPVPLFVK